MSPYVLSLQIELYNYRARIQSETGRRSNLSMYVKSVIVGPTWKVARTFVGKKKRGNNVEERQKGNKDRSSMLLLTLLTRKAQKKHRKIAEPERGYQPSKVVQAPQFSKISFGESTFHFASL